MSWPAVVLTIAALIALQALYVAAEFATVSARRSRLTQLAQEGDRRAAGLVRVIEDPRRLDAYIAACQVGITASNLILGYYGQARLTPVIAPALAAAGVTSPAAAPSVAATAVLLLLTTIQVILGELVPKNIGVQYPERLAIATVLPMRWSIALFRPLIALFNGSGRLILRALGHASRGEDLHIHRPEEIIMLVAESGAGGLLDPEERRLLENTLRWRDLVVKQTMVSRTRLLAAPIDLPRAEMVALLAASSYSRLLLFEGSIDNIRGVVHLKDLLCPGSEGWDVRRVIRTVPMVPETAPVAEVFARLQREQEPIAVVLDEYGGTAGMVTTDDVIAAIFGELQDEFDTAGPPVQSLPDSRLLVRGDTRVGELNEWFDMYLPDDDADTIGGLVQSRLGRVPRVGDEVIVADVAVRIERMDGHAVSAVAVALAPEQMARWRERGP